MADAPCAPIFWGFTWILGALPPLIKISSPRIFGGQKMKEMYSFSVYKYPRRRRKKRADICPVLGNDAGVFCALKRDTHF
jgi:hypothetical protein